MKNYEGKWMGKLFFLILVGLIIYFSIRSIFKPIKKPAKAPKYNSPKQEPETELVQDPECGVYLDPAGSITLKQEGKIYYFCSEECRDRFLNRLNLEEAK